MKFSGKVGFWIKDVEVKPSVFRSQIVEKKYTGDFLRNSRRFQPAENQQNDNLRVSGKISILANIYMQQNWPSIKYVEWNGIKWEVSSVDMESFPRVILELGGVYNGKKTT